MKMKQWLLVLLAAIMLFALAACTKSSDKVQLFSVDTGDEIWLRLDKKSDYELVFNDPYLVIKDGETIFEGAFAQQILYQNLLAYVPQDENAERLVEFEKDGNKVFVFSSPSPDTGEDEIFAIIKIADSKTCATLISTKTKDEVMDALDAIEYSINTAPTSLD